MVSIDVEKREASVDGDNEGESEGDESEVVVVTLSVVGEPEICVDSDDSGVSIVPGDRSLD